MLVVAEEDVVEGCLLKELPTLLVGFAKAVVCLEEEEVAKDEPNLVLYLSPKVVFDVVLLLPERLEAFAPELL
jgi:hypothetical protein